MSSDTPAILFKKMLEGKVLDVGQTKMARLSENRFVIYLPTNRNYLWQALHKKKVRVRIELLET